MSSNRRGRKALTAISITAVAGGLTLAIAGYSVDTTDTEVKAAAAVSPAIHIAGTGVDGVNIRVTPNTSQSPVGWMPEGHQPGSFNCFSHGEMVGNVDIWFNVTDGGVTGFYASYFDDSHYANDADITARYGIPACSAAQTPAPAPAATGHYNREAAATWARAHWNDPELVPGGDCTWFASNALWAGGVPQDDFWNDNPSYVAKFADALPRHLVAMHWATIKTIVWSDNTAGGAQVGDLIVYDWEKGPNGHRVDGADGEFDHIAIVTRIDDTGYPIVTQHTTARLERGWSWDPSAKNWIQYSYENSVAYLVHITY